MPLNELFTAIGTGRFGAQIAKSRLHEQVDEVGGVGMGDNGRRERSERDMRRSD